jgi:PKD repeat protein
MRLAKLQRLGDMWGLCLTLALGACGGGGDSAPSAPPVSQSPTAPVITVMPAMPAPGVTTSFSATSTDPAGLSLTYAWDFGDGAKADGPTAMHAFANAGTFSVMATATNANNKAASSKQDLIVQNAAAIKLTNPQEADCAGTDCAASNATTYTGTGLGVWKYVNTSASDALVDLSIGGVSAGKSITLLFSNGALTAGTTKPGGGTLLEPAQLEQSAMLANKFEEAHDAAHAHMQARNRSLGQMLKAQRTAGANPLTAEASSTTLTPAVRRISAAPAVGATRTWKDTFPSTPVAYTVAVNSTCATANGRNLVFWLDVNATTTNAADMTTLTSRFCGASGAFAQLTGLIGDAWGTAGFSNLIGDSPLQDINVVIIKVPNDPGWAGYFDSTNNFRTSSQAKSNEAIGFTINANQIHDAGVNFISSTLIHEATHMINFYQRYILKNKLEHDTWLEETTATMSEDLLANSVFGAGVYNKIAGRTNKYLATGGGIDYVNWPSTLSGTGNYYNVAGAFGAYLNRRYGTVMFKQLAANCDDSFISPSSYNCVDAIAKANGTAGGFAEDYAHFGASVFARIAPTGQPAAYGYPAKTEGGYSFSAFDLSTSAAPTPATITGGMKATTHIFQTDTVAAGKTSYARSGITVPANTTLIVVIN